jgi:hypothetical protein
MLDYDVVEQLNNLNIQIWMISDSEERYYG